MRPRPPQFKDSLLRKHLGSNLSSFRDRNLVEIKNLRADLTRLTPRPSSRVFFFGQQIVNHLPDMSTPSSPESGNGDLELGSPQQKRLREKPSTSPTDPRKSMASERSERGSVSVSRRSTTFGTPRSVRSSPTTGRGVEVEERKTVFKALTSGLRAKKTGKAKRNLTPLPGINPDLVEYIASTQSRRSIFVVAVSGVSPF